MPRWIRTQNVLSLFSVPKTVNHLKTQFSHAEIDEKYDHANDCLLQTRVVSVTNARRCLVLFQFHV